MFPYIASSKDSEKLGEFGTVIQTLDCLSGLHNCLNSPKMRLPTIPERVEKHSTLNYMATLAMNELSSEVSETFLLVFRRLSRDHQLIDSNFLFFFSLNYSVVNCLCNIDNASKV